MARDETLDELIGTLSEAALEPGLWREAFAELGSGSGREAVGAREVPLDDAGVNKTPSGAVQAHCENTP